MPTIQNEPDFQKFCKDLESLKGRVVLHQPPDRLMARVMAHRPLARRLRPSNALRVFRWVTPFALGGCAALLWFLLLSPAAPFALVRKIPVTFVFEKPDVSSVHVVGDFNQWDARHDPMRRDNARWVTTLYLPAGRYEYQYFVNGQPWSSRALSPATVRDGYGGTNQVVAAGRLALWSKTSQDPLDGPTALPRHSPSLRALFQDLADQARAVHLPESLFEWRIREGMSKAVSRDQLFSRLQGLVGDLKIADRWLAETGLPAPRNRAYALQVLAELIASGFTAADWRLLQSAMPAPHSSADLIRGAECVRLWQTTGIPRAQWESILRQASDLQRTWDLLTVMRAASESHTDPKLALSTLKEGMSSNRPVEFMLAAVSKPSASSR